MRILKKLPRLVHQVPDVVDMIHKKITDFILSLESHEIPKERKDILQPLMDYIQGRVSNNSPVQLNFICTHNSRRSQFSQIWGQTIANYFNLKQVNCFSGGTEATAVYPTVVETAKSIGFIHEKDADENNPKHLLHFSQEAKPIILFSKTIEASPNPASDFAAILTCSSADTACPFVPGADIRVPWTFEDPKDFDGTSQENEKYAERSTQIASELFYLFSIIKSK